jgi:hypothetical protein
MSKRHNPSGGRRFGYFISILINFGMIYVVNNLLKWNVPFLTDKFSQVLWAVNLSLGVNIFSYFTFLFFDRRWFKNLMQALSNVFSFISSYMFWQVFPLDVPESIEGFVNLAMVFILVLVALSVLIELTNAVRNYRKMIGESP